MDPIFFIGLIVTLAGILLAMVIDGNSIGPLIGPSAFMMVVVTSISAGIMAYRKHELLTIPKSAVRAFKSNVPDVQTTITELARLAEIARRDGMLALEAEIEHLDDRFLRLGVQLLVDGVDEEVVQETLDIELEATDERHRTAIGFFKGVSGYAPTFGMVGTVVALVNMLGNLEDPEQLGIGMALALLTTLYGVLIANLVFTPIAVRLERLNDDELAALTVAQDGVLSIRSGASPRGVVERLESYLPPSQRVGLDGRPSARRDERGAA